MIVGLGGGCMPTNRSEQRQPFVVETETGTETGRAGSGRVKAGKIRDGEGGQEEVGDQIGNQIEFT